MKTTKFPCLKLFINTLALAFVLVSTNISQANLLTCEAYFWLENASPSRSLVPASNGTALTAEYPDVTLNNFEINFGEEAVVSFLEGFSETIGSLSTEQRQAMENLYGEDGPFGNMDFILMTRKLVVAMKDNNEKLYDDFIFYFTKKEEVPFEFLRKLAKYFSKYILKTYKTESEELSVEKAKGYGIGSKLAIKRRKSILDFYSRFDDQTQAKNVFIESAFLSSLQLGLFTTYGQKGSGNKAEIGSMFLIGQKNKLNPLSLSTTDQIVNKKSITDVFEGVVWGGGISALVSSVGLGVIDFVTGIPLFTGGKVLLATGTLTTLINILIQSEDNSIFRSIKYARLKALAKTNATLSGEIAKAFIQNGKVELITGPKTNKLDGEYHPPLLEAKKELIFEEVQSQFLQLNEEGELHSALAELQSTTSAALIAAGSGFQLTDKDFSKTLEAFTKIRNGRPPRKLRGHKNQQKAYLIINSHVQSMKHSISETQNVINEVRKIIEFLSITYGNNESVQLIVESLKNMTNGKESGLSQYIKYSDDLNEIAESILTNDWEIAETWGKAQKASGTALVITEQISTDIITTQGIVASVPALAFQNQYQQEAYELTKDKRYFKRLKERLHIFNNQYQIDVLKILLSRDINVYGEINVFADISNQWHVQYIQNILYKKSYLPSEIEKILQVIQNEYQYAVADYMTQNNKKIRDDLIDVLRSIENTAQVDLLRYMIEERPNYIDDLGPAVPLVLTDLNFRVIRQTINTKGLVSSEWSVALTNASSITMEEQLDVLTALENSYISKAYQLIAIIAKTTNTLKLTALKAMITNAPGSNVFRDLRKVERLLEMVTNEAQVEAFERFSMFPSYLEEFSRYLPKVNSLSIANKIPAYGVKKQWNRDFYEYVPRDKDDGIKGWSRTRRKAVEKYLEEL